MFSKSASNCVTWQKIEKSKKLQEIWKTNQAKKVWEAKEEDPFKNNINRNLKMLENCWKYKFTEIFGKYNNTGVRQSKIFTAT